MQVNFHQLDDFGCVKPPLWFYAALAFLLHPWLVAISALASRSQTNELLLLFYPASQDLLLSMAVCSPMLLLFFTVGRRRPEASRLTRWLWRRSYWLLGYGIVSEGAQLWLQISGNRGEFSWSLAILLCCLLWTTLMVTTSQQLRLAVQEFPGAKRKNSDKSQLSGKSDKKSKPEGLAYGRESKNTAQAVENNK